MRTGARRNRCPPLAAFALATLAAAAAAGTTQAQNPYRNLATLSNPDTGLFVYRTDWRDPADPPEYSWKATYLSGVVVQNASNANDPGVIFPLGAPPPTVPPLIVNIGGAATPVVNSYITQFANAPGTTNVPWQPGPGPYILNALSHPDSIAFFRSNEPGAWSLEVDVSNPRVNVSGTCVWLFDRGFRVTGTLRVQGSGAPSDMLVLVGGRSQTTNLEDRDAGLALLGSIYSPNVPVILVSDGNVLVEHRDLGSTWPDDNNASVVNCLSIFATSARIMGPDANYDYSVSAAKLIFGHPNDHPANVRIDRLVGLGLLPNTSAPVIGQSSGPIPEQKLALLGVVPNPAVSKSYLRVRLSLSQHAPATLRIVDVSGRVMAGQDLPSLGPGVHEVDLVLRRRLPTGLYWLRLSQGSRSLARKVTILS